MNGVYEKAYEQARELALEAAAEVHEGLAPLDFVIWHGARINGYEGWAGWEDLVCEALEVICDTPEEDKS